MYKGTYRFSFETGRSVYLVQSVPVMTTQRHRLLGDIPVTYFATSCGLICNRQQSRGTYYATDCFVFGFWPH